jgi:hypothetical protein
MYNSKLIAVIALVSLSGCAGKIRYPNYYALDLPVPAPSANQPTPAHGSAAVRQFDAPRFLRGGAIAYWEVTAAMVREMQSLGLFQSVDVSDGRGSPECLVTGTFEHLEEAGQGTIQHLVSSMQNRLPAGTMSSVRRAQDA